MIYESTLIENKFINRTLYNCFTDKDRNQIFEAIEYLKSNNTKSEKVINFSNGRIFVVSR